jgi:hypothetical protein
MVSVVWSALAFCNSINVFLTNTAANLPPFHQIVGNRECGTATLEFLGKGTLSLEKILEVWCVVAAGGSCAVLCCVDAIDLTKKTV